MPDLLAALNALGTAPLLVVGDLILDRYTWGAATRVSPEAPVLVLHAEHEEERPGGAAGVAALARALDAPVTLAGVVGDDDAGRALSRLLAAGGIEAAGVLVDPDRPTTRKERFLGWAAHRRPQQVLRVDREDTRPLPAGPESRLVGAVRDRLAGHGAVLVSDYAKGVCTPALLAAVFEAAAARGVPVCVDPARIADYDRYRGATLLTPNRVEAALATGRPVETPADGVAAAEALRDRLGVGAVLVKLDRDGMALACAGQPGRHFPTTPREVCDVTGAGDLVLAVVGLACASGLAWEEAVPLANLAAGLEVEQVGVARLTRADLRLAAGQTSEVSKTSEVSGCPRKLVSADEMAERAAAYRRQGKTVVLTNGCFDLLHAGHVAYLREAAELGDVLVVAVNSDASVRRLKGPDRPVIGEADRAALLAALSCVGHVVVFEEDTPAALLERVRPDVLVKGGTYGVDGVVGKEVVEAYGGRVCVTGRRTGLSTTAIVAAVRHERPLGAGVA